MEKFLPNPQLAAVVGTVVAVTVMGLVMAQNVNLPSVFATVQSAQLQQSAQADR
jgi:hypothetical protein